MTHRVIKDAACQEAPTLAVPVGHSHTPSCTCGTVSLPHTDAQSHVFLPVGDSPVPLPEVECGAVTLRVTHLRRDVRNFTHLHPHCEGKGATETESKSFSIGKPWPV